MMMMPFTRALDAASVSGEALLCSRRNVTVVPRRCLFFVTRSADVCSGAGGIPGIESSNGEACCLASCGLCGGEGCAGAGEDSDCCGSDIAQRGEACSVKGSAPCYIDAGRCTRHLCAERRLCVIRLDVASTSQ